VRTTIRMDAADPKRGMTVKEAEEFVQKARDLGNTDNTTIHAAVGWRGQITRLETR